MTKTDENRAAWIRSKLREFTETTVYFHSKNQTVVYTEGVQFLAKEAGAYWLIDDIASYFPCKSMAEAMKEDERLQSLQFWRLERLVGGDCRGARLTARADSGCEPFIVQHIEYTDFPLDSIDVWAGLGFDGNHWVLYLPSEH